MIIHSITATQAIDEKELYCNAIEKDEIIAQVLAWQATNPQDKMGSLYKQFKKIGDKWFFGNRIYIPDNENIKLEILRKYHDVESAGHQGYAEPNNG